MTDWEAWAALLALGAFHGINPGMGWLFAVALGLQEGRRRAVFRALVPIAIGHALSIGAVVLVVGLAQEAIPLEWLRWPIGAGHPCIGCTERNFWDTMTPFYNRLPNVAGLGIEQTADTIGAALAAGALAGVAAHAAATTVHQIRSNRKAAAAEGAHDGQD